MDMRAFLTAPSAKRAAADEDAGADEPPPKRQTSSGSTSTAADAATFILPSASRKLRGVAVPHGWGVFGGSLLAWLHGAPVLTSKIAAFDFDGCLADTPLGGFDPNAWELQYPHVPQVLASLVASGHTIVVVTNESMDRYKNNDAIAKCIAKKVGRLEGFCSKVQVPMLVLCATAKDGFRKPATGAWKFAADALSASTGGKVAVDISSSFFVGDAAGRKGDHSDSDKVFAAHSGVKFYDEKTFFEQMHRPA